MKDMNIDQPNGYLLDADDRVVMRFANWSSGDHHVPDAVDSVEYVDGPSDHDRGVHDIYKTDE